MKNLLSNPKVLALYNALPVTLLVILLLLINGNIADHPFSPGAILTAGILVFTVSYLLINFSVRKYLDNKIRVIYKSIRTSKVPKANEEKLKRISLEKVDKEVQKWTEDKKQEIEELKKMAAYRREFLGNVSHELKTPVFNIQGYVSTLLDGGIDDPVINRKYLERTEKSVTRLISIIQDLEKISTLESGELILEITRFDLAALIREVLEFLEIKVKQYNKSVLTSFDLNKAFYVRADRERIKDVLINLLENSFKYGNPVHGRTMISIFDTYDRLLIEITDNGPGMEATELNRIFERFYRIDKSRTSEKGGTGLGLSIVKHIIDAHEESVNVRSNIGIGTTFAFTLRKALS